MDIIIDYRIRDWVFIPLILVMFLVNFIPSLFLNSLVWNFAILHQFIPKKLSLRIKSDQQKIVRKFHKLVLFNQFFNNLIPPSFTIQKCQKLQANCEMLPESSFGMRKYYLCRKDEGLLYCQKDQPPPDPMSMMMNTGMMGDMLKNNISMAVSTMFQFAWVSYFFSGFILAKVPFPLTQTFRGLLQKGVEIANLDVRYVSSLSLYFLVLFGLHQLYGLILDAEDSEDLSSLNEMNTQMKAMGPMGMGGGAPGQPPDFNKLFTSERENLEIIKHKFLIENIDEILIEKLKKRL